MNKDKRFKLLLEAGYFPSELPPPFNTHDLAKFRNYIIGTWNGFANEYSKSTPEIFSYPRIRRIRRNLAIVNPVAQVHVAKLIADEWAQIQKHIKKSKYSIEVPDIVENKTRAVPPPDFALVSLRRTEISAVFNHSLISDISRFYGTLYTHALAWALHTKSWCKKNLNKNHIYDASLGARLDKAIRKGQDNQTIGIPVGPDTSRVASEIIGASLDEMIQEELGLDEMRAFRHVDDWYIGFDNAGEAEDAIAVLARACRHFELELNPEKTSTHRAAPSAGVLWPSELREHRIRKGRLGQAKSIEHFFTASFDFAERYPDQNVLDFAIKRSKSIKIINHNWHLYETYLLKAARSNPTVLPSVAQILISYNHNGFTLGKRRIKKLVDDIIERNAPTAFHAEVAWALFLSKALGIKIGEGATSSVSGLESSVCALLALDLRNRNLIDGKLDTSLWEESMNQSGLYSDMWLLAYEADLKGWIKGSNTGFVQADPYFSAIRRKKISFYDEEANVQHIRKSKPPKPSNALLEFLKSIDMDEFYAAEYTAASLSSY